MRRLLFTSLFTLAFIIGAAGAAPAAQALTPEEICGEQFSDTSSNDYLNCIIDATNPDYNPDGDTTIQADIEAATARTPVTPDTSPKLDGVFAQVMNFIMSLFAWLLGVAVITLDNTVYLTVLKMGVYISGDGTPANPGLSAIGVTWRILRDIGNIILIFGFLAAGIATIINVNIYGWSSKMLPKLLVAAVFLNFSLFITEAVIDVGNLFATQFYTQINGGNPPSLRNWDLTAISNEGISNKIMSQLGMAQIYGAARTNSALVQGTTFVLIGFMSIIVFLIAAFVMFSLAFILIARFVILVFLIVLAPIGFAGLAVPKLEGMASKWWSKLFEQTITAPVLLLLLYVALAVITDTQFLLGIDPTGKQDWAGFASGNLTGFGSLMLGFLIAMGLLLAVVIAAKSMSAFGAGWATKTAGKVTFGLTAWGATRTAGRLASYTGRGLRQSKTFNKFDAFTGRATTRALDKVATGSLDIRGTKLFKVAGVEVGEAAKEGFVGAQKRNIEQHEKAAKAIEQAHKDSPDTHRILGMFGKEGEQERIAKTTKQYEQALIDEAQERRVRDEIQQRHNAAKRERDRLADIDTRDKEAGRPSSVANELGTADLKFNEVAKNLAFASDKFKQASDALTAAKKEKEIAEKAPEARRTADAKESKRAYAEAINHPILNVLNPLTLAGYGPGDSMAARKIKESLKEKGNKDKIFDAVMAEQKRIQTEESETEKEKSGTAGAEPKASTEGKGESAKKAPEPEQ